MGPRTDRVGDDGIGGGKGHTGSFRVISRPLLFTINMSPVGVRAKEKSYKGEDGEENQLAVGKIYISGTTGFNDRAWCQPPSALIFRDASTNLHRKIKETGLE